MRYLAEILQGCHLEKVIQKFSDPLMARFLKQWSYLNSFQYLSSNHLELKGFADLKNPFSTSQLLHKRPYQTG